MVCFVVAAVAVMDPHDSQSNGGAMYGVVWLGHEIRAKEEQEGEEEKR